MGNLLVWGLMLHMSIPPDIFSVNRGGFGEVNSMARIIKLALLAFGAFATFSRMGTFKPVMRRMNRFYLAFLVLVPLSYLWSISPADTLTRYVSLLTVTFVALGVAIGGWTPVLFAQSLRSVIAVVLAGSIVFGILQPDLAIEHDKFLNDAWHGLTVTKNAFGQLASFGAIFWFHAWLSREKSAIRILPFMAISFTCLILSRSSTATLATLFAMIFMFMLARTPPGLKRYMPYIIAVFASVVVTYALAVLRIVPGLDIILEPIAALTGKDMTFSARSTIWEIIKEHVQLSPYIGSGYGAYWIGPVLTSPSIVFLPKMYFYPGESHNGYLEIVNDLGFLGLTVLLGYMAVYVRQALALLRVNRAHGALFLGLFFEQAINNLSEATWFDMNATFIFSIMTLATAALARALVDSEYAGGTPAAAAAAPFMPGQRPPGMRGRS